ncbi:dihydroorotate dehydrogenase electron transfer subunit [Thiorhodospira sibirica]|uniref:dihydroorotate dehydrogenase electron transfer subunit n=1 Tax=Thiorhodospira sibirica TaxID=154347 RepID=UPI00022C04F4|nr:dihydroorotate dehydrogenase electron transfer subunit [Thiorhodospira sibirica]
MSSTAHRDTLFVEQAPIIHNHRCPGGQYLLRLKAPICAQKAQPGQFIHLQCDPHLPLRRPLSILSTDADAGVVDLLYLPVGQGTQTLTTRKAGEILDLIGPIGQPFSLPAHASRPLLLGGGVGIPPVLFLAARLAANAHHQPLAFLGSELPFPFDTRKAALDIPGLPTEASDTLSCCEDWGIPTRLSSRAGLPGCFNGFVTELADHWLKQLAPAERAKVTIYACGPHPMLAACAALAKAYQLPCQVSLEEHMACGVGGCAGCVVETQQDGQPRMQRVCVDGPVFDAYQVF